VTWPIPIPQDAKYYKVDDNGFYEFSDAVFNDNTVSLTLTDGDSGDGDKEENYVIVDPGGVAVPKSGGGGGGDTGSGGGCFIGIVANSLS
jgi:hypothetical protein